MLELPLEIVLPPHAEMLNDLRRLVEAFCAAERLRPDRAEAAGMAVHELAQNGMAYSSGGAVEVRVAIDRPTNALEVRVRNAASPRSVEALKEHLTRVQRAPDPLAL